MNTPTPWRIDPLAPWLIIDEPGDSVCQTQQRVSLAKDQNQTERKANAALIVRAVNSHQSLIDALENIIKADAYRMAAIAAPDGEKHYEPATENFWAAIDKGRAALALAKEPT